MRGAADWLWRALARGGAAVVGRGAVWRSVLRYSAVCLSVAGPRVVSGGALVRHCMVRDAIA